MQEQPDHKHAVKCRVQRLKRLFVLFATLALIPSSGGFAQTLPTPAPSPCDPQYYESLRSRAWMEAQREITSNQTLIYKPDSVLQYTCFDQFGAELARDAQFLFSENQRWGNILPVGSMGTALQDLIGGAFDAYLLSNFNHSVLGGRSTAFSYTPTRAVPYNCDVMGRVWQEAKCSDFIRNANDGFFTFQDYANPTNQDRRYLPSACGNISATWTYNIQRALVDTVPAGSPAGTTSTLWTEDNLVTFMAMINPENCGLNPDPANGRPLTVEPIPTGIVVQRSSVPTTPAGAPTVYNEFVCIAPGCYYEPTNTGYQRCVRP